MYPLTAANDPGGPPGYGAADTALSSQGVGGVCSVVSTGMSSIGAMASGRWWRAWLWTTSKLSASGWARAMSSRRYAWWSLMNRAGGIEQS